MRWPKSVSRSLAIAAVALSVLGLLGNARAETLLESMDREVSTLYEKSKDALVKVHAQRRTAGGFVAYRVSTGFFAGPPGQLLTVATVVEAADSCWIDWRGQHVPVKILGRDPHTNIAVLQVDPEQPPGQEPPAPSLPEGNSDELRVGSMVIALGYPYDLPSSPAVGFVSGLDIRHGSQAFVTRHIRASCRLSPGQGGGPLLNCRGEVVGVVVAAHREDHCYALPMRAARKISTDIAQHGQPCYGWVGLGVTERYAETTVADGAGPDATPAEQPVVLVQQVISNTPAAAAGFQAQDELVQIGGRPVHRLEDVLDTIFFCRAGEQITFAVRRDGREHQLTLMVGERPVEVLAATPGLPLVPTGTRERVLPLVPATGSR